MIKLLIVNDEPLVQIGIKSMLNWTDYGIEVCGTVVNGASALELIGEYSPELIITDIRIPIMNGLELVKTRQETYGKIPLSIILTSYEEFQLVKEALSYQVVDYLMKLELGANTLGESVGRALERLKELKATEETRSIGKPLLQIYHDKFFLRLLHNLFNSGERSEFQVQDLSLDSSDRCYVVVQYEIHEKSQAAGMEHEKLLNPYNSTIQMAGDILNKHLPCHVTSLDMRHFMVLFHFPATENIDSGKMMEALTNASSMAHSYFSVWLPMGAGSAVDVPLKICESFQNARMAFAMADREHPIVSCSQATPEVHKNSFNISVFKNDIAQAFEELDTDVLYDTLTQVMNVFTSNPMRYFQAIDRACNTLYLAISLLPEGETTLSEISADYSDGYRSIYRLGNMEQVLDWMKTLRDGLYETLKSKKVTYKKHVITNVRKHVQSHIEERLILNDAVGVFELSPNYLSVLFKKTYDIGFSEYITQMKISKAKTLLLEQDMKIYKMANELGFKSAFCFSKVFKKVEGISPREYVQQKTNS